MFRRAAETRTRAGCAPQTIAFDKENMLAHARRVCNDRSVTTRFTYWIEGDGKYLGYLNDYPDHWTQGDNIKDLKDHLRDLHETFSAEDIPGIKKEAELELA